MCVSRIRNKSTNAGLTKKQGGQGLNVRSAVMSIERPDARLKERGVIPARGGTTSLPSERKRLPSKTSR